MLGKEPVAIIGIAATILQSLGLLWVNDWNVAAVDAELWLIPILTAVGILPARQQVMPVETIKDAGFSPKAIQSRADDPAVARAK